MKSCDHTHWFSLCAANGEASLQQTKRPEALIRQIPRPHLQQPSLFVLIGNTEKSTALRAISSSKRNRRFAIKRNHGEVHLHLDPSGAFNDRPMLIAEGDIVLSKLNPKSLRSEKCHETILRSFQRPFDMEHAAVDIYGQLLYPYTDLFCFFSADLGGFGQIACFLAQLLNRTSKPKILPSVVIVFEADTSHHQWDRNAKETFISLIRGATIKNPFDYFAQVDVIAVQPKGRISDVARYRPVKERLMRISDQIREYRRDSSMLFSANHLAAILEASSDCLITSHEPIDVVRISRIQNPVAPDLDEHLSTMLQGALSPRSACPEMVFETLYKGAISRATSGQISDMVASDFIGEYGRDCHHRDCDKNSAVEIHRNSLVDFRPVLQGMRSSSTCLCCLRRRPQYCLPCGHCLCENCIIVFGESTSDVCVFKVSRCFLCDQEMREEITVRVRPLTAGAGFLCIDGGGARGIIPLTIMKLIQDRLGSIPLQRCIPLSFGVSVGAIIATEHFILGRPLDESIRTFSDMVTQVFKPRKSSSIPVLSQIVRTILAYFTDGLYPASNINNALREWIQGKNLLDCSHATSTGTKVGLPVATVSELPSFRFFTNYNGVGERDAQQDRGVIKPKEGHANVPLGVIIFPPEHIEEVGTFQDPGPLENDPLLWALSEFSALYPRLQAPDFAISLGTGEPAQTGYDASTEDRRGVLMENMRGRAIRRVSRALINAGQKFPRYHRLSIAFGSTEPRLDDVDSIPELIARVRADKSLGESIDNVAHCLIASLFYFELDSLPEWRDGGHVLNGRILCCIRPGDAEFDELLMRLTGQAAKFHVNDGQLSGVVTFGERVQIQVSEEFTISMKLKDGKAYSISGSPFTVKSLVQAQGLDAHFGRADHRKRKRSIWNCASYHNMKRQCIERN
ncbi:hypothetical protein BDV96DRAFT_601192 [Lophiotrema nucula]|uniref:PNPLA domain-containing protein n=1 Tax=Lophiotrema nucula TaxID=690887 RepID=A0A6A5Z3R5_9PLEO|nr:hypothetical protein BDV96DRAFT_601192 [Lophiotrema nucula]